MDLLNLVVPVLVRTRRSEAPAARALFGSNDTWTSRATLELTLQALRRELARDHAAGLRGDDHRPLAADTRLSDIELTRWRGDIVLRSGTLQCTMSVARLSALAGESGFFVDIPTLWFHVPAGETFDARAGAALTGHFKQLEKTDPEAIPADRNISPDGRLWLESLTIQVPNRRGQAADNESRADLFATNSFDGFFELLDRGECLDDLTGESRDTCFGRARETDLLRRLLTASDRRPILLVGERDVGKTAILHDAVRREIEHKVASRSAAYRGGRERTFRLSPQRLIAGMMYVGQWEGRLRAILEHASKWQHTLVFDNLLGLFQAGRTSKSDTCFADLLRPWLAQREIRFVAETTPEGLRLLRERDRGFADLFHLIRVHPFTPAETLRLLVELRRESEDTHALAIDPEALPGLCQFCAHFQPDAAFPGKAVGMLREIVRTQLAATPPRDEAPALVTTDPLDSQVARPISMGQVWRTFAARTGYRFDFLDRQATVTRAELEEQLAARVRGQPTAVRAAADAILLARARLADPGRPLASMLFLGSTGVGKTEMAKAVAAVMFADPDRFLRFDLNEFATPDSVPRLFGTFGQPDGLLTGAVRRQPSGVLLFDEIEKAHPDVFDLLLQVLGEGRLTDAHGRTVSFQHMLIFMTSNLGVKEAQAGLGFGATASVGNAHFIRAAENFFRPEFFNRIDRVVPFELLSAEEIERIAHGLLQRVLVRPGIRRRQCLIDLTPDMAAWLASEVRDHRFGARALKRVVESRLVQPIADQLAAARFETPVILSLHAPAPAGAPTVALVSLRQCEPDTGPALRLLALPPRECWRVAIEFARQLLARVTSLPLPAATSSEPSARQVEVWQVQERLRELIEQLDDLAAGHETSHRLASFAHLRISLSRGGAATRGYTGPRASLLRELCEADDVAEFLTSLFRERPGESGLPEWRSLFGELARLAAVTDAIARDEQVEGITLCWRWLGWRDRRIAASLTANLTRMLHGDVRFDPDRVLESSATHGTLTLTHWRVREFVSLIVGHHLVYSDAGELGLLVLTERHHGPDLEDHRVITLTRQTGGRAVTYSLRSGEVRSYSHFDYFLSDATAAVFEPLLPPPADLKPTKGPDHG